MKELLAKIQYSDIEEEYRLENVDGHELLTINSNRTPAEIGRAIRKNNQTQNSACWWWAKQSSCSHCTHFRVNRYSSQYPSYDGYCPVVKKHVNGYSMGECHAFSHINGEMPVYYKRRPWA